MKKAFSLLEIILVILIIASLAAFIIPKFKDSLDFTNKTKIKSDIALIRNAISKKISSNRLLNQNENFTLDNEVFEKEGSKLFANVLELPFLSTSSIKKESAKWIKISSNSYKIYISKDEFLLFTFDNNSFSCKSSKDLCESFE